MASPNPAANPFAGACPPPFMDASLFPTTGGFIQGRLCQSLSELPGAPNCCAPCPVQNLVFPSSFGHWNTAVQWINVVSLAMLSFLTLSFIFLPREATRRHYLSVSIMAPFILLTLGFVIPLAAQPDPCFNEITPNDMYSSMTCAWGGAFVLSGALGIATWIFLRALYMHVQICWDMNPGVKFFYLAQVFGWGVPAAFFVATITLTGVSFRLGNQCLINHNNSLETFWGPLIVLAGLALVLQLATFVYCSNVYLRNMWSEDKTSTELSSLPTYSSSLRPTTTRAVYRRMVKLLQMQWRGMVNVFILVTDVVAFVVVFLALDRAQSDTNSLTEQEWGLCLVIAQGDVSKCFKEAEKFLTSETTVVVILIMLALAGIETVLLFFHWSIVTGWRDLIMSWMPGSQREFVSLDARKPANNNYMLNQMSPQTPSYPTPTWQTRTDDFMKETYTIGVAPLSPIEGSEAGTMSPHPGDFHRNNSIRTFQSFDRPGSSASHERTYRTPTRSFSSPRTPGRNTMVDADLRSAGARGGLGLNPPVEDEDEDVDEIEEMDTSAWTRGRI